VNAETFAKAKHGHLQSLLFQHHQRHSINNQQPVLHKNNIVEYYDYGIQKSLFFHDPDQNIVELTLWQESEQHNEDLHSLERLSFKTLSSSSSSDNHHDHISLRTMTDKSPLYTSSYADSNFTELPWWYVHTYYSYTYINNK